MFSTNYTFIIHLPYALNWLLYRIAGMQIVTLKYAALQEHIY